MPKVKIKETVAVGGKTFFAGDAFVSDDDAAALADFADQVEANENETNQNETNPDKALKKPLSKMTKAELVAEAEGLSVAVTPDAQTNKEIIAAIEAKTNAPQE